MFKQVKVCVIGLGPVGAVSALCYAKQGLNVVGVDKDRERLAAFQAGKLPFVEPKADALLAEVLKGGHFHVEAKLGEAVKGAEVIIIAVGTPVSEEDGSPDLSALERVAEQLGVVLAKQHHDEENVHIVPTIAVRSTIPPGTLEEVLAPIIEEVSGLTAGKAFYVASNPEFLREGHAVDDFFQPSRLVIGASHKEAAEAVRMLYKKVKSPVFVTDIKTAEFAKYADNSWHALKVAFANEMGRTVEAFGGDVQATTDIFLSDDKLNISSHYLRPGFAFGGSCLPKDVSGLNWLGQEGGIKLPLINAILPSNEAHIERAIAKILATGSDPVGLLGMAFKPHVDDLRESPTLKVASALVAEGKMVLIHDCNIPVGTEIRLPHEEDVRLTIQPLEVVVEGADYCAKFHDIEEYNALPQQNILSFV